MPKNVSQKFLVTIGKNNTAQQIFLKKLVADTKLNSHIGFNTHQSTGSKLLFLAMEYYKLQEVNYQKKLVGKKANETKKLPKKPEKTETIEEILL